MSEFNIANIGSQEDFIEYATDSLVEDNNSIVIAQYENILKIINKLEEIDDSIIISDNVNEDTEGYDIVVIRNIDGIFIVTNFIDKEGYMNYITADYILCEDILEDEDYDEYLDAREEFKVVSYDNKEDEYEDCDEDICDCIDCKCCHEKPFKVTFEGDNINNENSVIDNETEEFLFKKTFDFVDKGFTPDQLFDFVSEIYSIAYEDGQKSNMLELRDMLDEILDED